jgi:hypothetical protein
METTVIPGLTLLQRLGNLDSFLREEKTVCGGFYRKQYAEKGGQDS